MNIVIVNDTVIPAFKYGGTERVIWYLGKALAAMGHKVSYLVAKGSYCDFANVIERDPLKDINQQIPANTDIVHFNYQPHGPVAYPYIVTVHGNFGFGHNLDINSVFVSGNHAGRYGSNSFVYNGLDWDDLPRPDLNTKRKYFHFLGKGAWRIKNLQGAIDVVKATPAERLKVLGGSRLNIKMGFRLTLNPRISFYGMVGGDKKTKLLNGSKGLIFPVRWHEPFGLALIESLYFGCPVFGTPYGSLPEIVNKEVGFLSVGKTELAQAVFNADAFDKRLCNQYAIDVFNANKMAEAYLEKYTAVLQGQTLNAVSPTLQTAPEGKFLPWVD